MIMGAVVETLSAICVSSENSIWYQSVSRNPPSAHTVPQMVSPQLIEPKMGGELLQPPLVSVPHGSPSSAPTHSNGHSGGSQRDSASLMHAPSHAIVQQ